MKNKNSKNHGQRNLPLSILAYNNKKKGMKFTFRLQSISLYRFSILLLIIVSSGCNLVTYVPETKNKMIDSPTARETRSVPTSTYITIATITPSMTIAPKSTNTPTPTSSPTTRPPMPLDGEIAYTAHVIDDPNDPYYSHHPEARILRLVNRESIRITESPDGSVSPKWSPDGKRIAYLSIYDPLPTLYILDLETGETHEIENVWTFDWSKDSQSIVYCEFGSWQVVEEKEFYYYIVRMDDLSNPSVLLISEWQASELHWSPTEDRILAVGSRQFGTTDLGSHIYLIDLTGGVQEIYTQKTPDGHVAWHPNGEKIAYAVYPETYEEPSEIRTIDLLTLEEQEITNSGANPQYPEWSPDGKKLAYESDATLASPPPRRVYIYILDLETGKTIKLVGNQDGHMTYPIWSPDGQYLAFLQGPSIWPLTKPYIGDSLNIYDIETGRVITVLNEGVKMEPINWKP